MKKTSVAFIIFFSFLLAACGRRDSEMLFTRLHKNETGIDFVNLNNETELSNILTYEYFYNGGGVALGDVNNDGLTDIYFTSNIYDNRLYLNEGNFKFRDITASSGTACAKGWKTGTTMADINGDGFLDIFVCRSASPNPDLRENILLINNGNLTFTNKAKEYNLNDASYSTQAAFFDFDRDSDLDMVLLNHSLLEISNVLNITLRNTMTRFPDVGNKFYVNNNGRFVDVSDSVGVFGPASNYGLGVSLSDIDDDGWIDMYTGCDYTGRDRLLLNEEGKRFQDVTENQLSHISKFTMGTDIADVNGDARMDIFTLDMLPEDNRRQKQLMGADRYDVHLVMTKSGLHSQYMRNMLHLNNGNGTFSEIGQLAGVANTDWSWAALIADYDNDAIQDIFVTNGFKRDLTDNDFAKYKAAQEIEAARRQGKNISTIQVIEKFTENKISNYIFKGNGDLTFSNETEAWGMSEPGITNGAAYADLDNDGDLDMVLNNMNDEAGVYRNNSEKLKNNFLKIQLKGNGKNTFGVGSKLTVYAGKKIFVREMLPVRGFQSTVDHILHVGLGSNTGIDSIQLRWPSGYVSLLHDIKVNQTITLSETESDPALSAKQPPLTTYFVPVQVVDFIHRENEFNDFNIQPLLPRMYSTEGPALAAADVNSDGLTDLFVGAAKSQIGKIFVQIKNGEFREIPQPALKGTIDSEDVDALFFDMDNDKDQDLYVVSGGYEFRNNDEALADALFENDGKGNFILHKLPQFTSSGSCVSAADVDMDGDADLFVGGRIVPGRYPESPESVLFLNDGHGNFVADTTQSESLRFAGMVTDALWLDLNLDNQPDLIVTGEWMPLKIFINRNGKLIDESSAFIQTNTEGLWNCLLAEDFDGDGDQDLLAGNHGLNHQMKASKESPVVIYYADYDQNGSVDPLLNYRIVDKTYPYPSRDELLEQLPSFKKRFTDYRSYSNVGIDRILLPEELSASSKLQATVLATCYFQNNGDHFEMKQLPLMAQAAPIFSAVALDVNNDGRMDVVTGGNLSAARARSGKLTGNYGMIGLGDGKGNFNMVHPAESGLNVKQDVRHMLFQNGVLIIGVNNGPLQTYTLKKQ